jgi:hypothetical protein
MGMGFELVGNFHTTGGANYFRGKGGSADTPALAVPTGSRMRRVGIIDTHGGWHGFNCCPDFLAAADQSSRPLSVSRTGHGSCSTSAAPQMRQVLPLGRASSEGSRGDPILQVRQ